MMCAVIYLVCNDRRYMAHIPLTSLDMGYM